MQVILNFLKHKWVKAILFALLSLCFWVGIWAIAAKRIDAELILPKPKMVWERFCYLLSQKAFYKTLGNSLFGIFSGFLIGLLLGILSALTVRLFSPARPFFSLPLLIMRAAPVASFSLLACFWMEIEDIPILIAAMMVFPIVYAGMQSGLQEFDRSLSEMLAVYQVSFWKRLRFFYLPSLTPYLTASAVTSFGLAWKAGVAAEILVTPKDTLGQHLYESKLYLESCDLFAYTLVVILCSLLCESLLQLLLRRRATTKSAFFSIGGSPT